MPKCSSRGRIGLALLLKNIGMIQQNLQLCNFTSKYSYKILSDIVLSVYCNC